MIDRIECDLEFSGRLTEEQSSKLFEIAQKCPVHRTLVRNRHSHARCVSRPAQRHDAETVQQRDERHHQEEGPVM